MSRKVIDLTGQQFGRWTAISKSPKPSRNALWVCRCSCGTVREVLSTHLRSGRSQSCGCMRRERLREAWTTHGMSRSREYESWKQAKQRCHNPNNPQYPEWGGKGITMCPEWRNDFQTFYAHIGPCPEGLTLDRIDNAGNYEPGNVRWATRKQQIRNRKNTVMLEHAGERLSASDWAERLGVSAGRLKRHVRNGGTLEPFIAKCITLPPSALSASQAAA